MSLENAKGTPLMVAFLVLIAIGLLVGLNFAFQGSVHFA